MNPAKQQERRKKEDETVSSRTGREKGAKRSLFSRLLDAGRRLFGVGGRASDSLSCGDGSDGDLHHREDSKSAGEEPAANRSERERKNQQERLLDHLKSEAEKPSLLVSDWSDGTGVRERCRPAAETETPVEDTQGVGKNVKQGKPKPETKTKPKTKPKTKTKGKKSLGSARIGEKSRGKPPDAPLGGSRRRGASHRRPRGPIDLVVGLDFGTSSTKVMIRSPYAYGGRVVPVALGHSKKCPFLLPTVLYQGARGSLSTTKRSSHAEHSALKLALMNEFEDPEVQARAAAYLALVVRKTKAWFDKCEMSNYARAKIRWSVNLGVPAETFDDEVICRTFREVLEAGWVLGESSEKLTIKTASNTIRKVRSGDGVSGVDIGVVPEVAAAVRSYATSMARKNGLHLVIDVGAGTLDVCGFILHTKDEEDVYPILKASVTPHGAFVLHQTRMDAADLRGAARQRRAIACQDLDAHVPDDLSFYARKGSKTREQVEVADSEFQRTVANAIMEVVMPLKKCRYPLSRCWEEGLPTFLCGGASHMEFYRNAVAVASERLYRTTGRRARFLTHYLASLECQGMSTDVGIPDAQFRRLVVAAGLSYPIDDIGKIRPESTIQDEKRVVAPPPADRYVSKDQV